jgi:hypothetical protein
MVAVSGESRVKKVAVPVLRPGAFSGLLSYGLFQVENSLHGWQLLFLIEGGLTVVCAALA